MTKEKVWIENIGWVIPPKVPAEVTQAKCTGSELDALIERLQKDKKV